MEMTFSWDSRETAIFRDRKIERALFNALSKSGNDAIRAMQAAAGRSVRQRKRLKVKFVKESLPLIFARGKTIDTLEWKMKVSGRAIPVSAYPHRQGKRGVTVAINTGARKLIKHAFTATMRSGHKGVFLREGKARLPIRELFTTRVSDVFADNGMIPAVMARTQKVFGESFARLLPLELAKIAPK